MSKGFSREEEAGDCEELKQRFRTDEHNCVFHVLMYRVRAREDNGVSASSCGLSNVSNLPELLGFRYRPAAGAGKGYVDG